MAEFHVVGSSETGVGKSVCASYLAQEFLARGLSVAAIDCDEFNPTLGKYTALNAETLALTGTFDKRVERRKFEKVSTLLLSKQHDVVVMDSGAHLFVPLVAHVAEFAVAELLKSAGIDCFMHLPIAAGHTGESLRNAIADAARALGRSWNVVLWQNEHSGPVDVQPFLKILRESGMDKARVVRLQELSYYHNEDVQEMLGQHLTFDEALARAKTNVAMQSRILTVRRCVSEALGPLCEARTMAKEARCV